MLAMGAYLYFEQFNLPMDVNVLLEDGHRHCGNAMEVMNAHKKLLGNDRYLQVLTVRVGGKKEHPLLQAADMLAYSEWQKLKGDDMEIYDSLHTADSKYQPEFIDLTTDLVDIVHGNALEWINKRKEWGKRVPGAQYS